MLEHPVPEFGNTFESGQGLNFANNANLTNSGDIAPLALLFMQFIGPAQAAQNCVPLDLNVLPSLSQDKEEVAEPSKRAPRAHIPTADKILLGVEDAMSLTTLPRAVIMDTVKTDQLPAQKLGRAWKIKRRDLDAFVNNL